jgi:hypothetical protein
MKQRAPAGASVSALGEKPDFSKMRREALFEFLMKALIVLSLNVLKATSQAAETIFEPKPQPRQSGAMLIEMTASSHRSSNRTTLSALLSVERQIHRALAESASFRSNQAQ